MPRPVEVRLLIIEADDLFRRNISERLRLENYEIFEANGETEAKNIIRRTDVDVVLLGLASIKKRGLALLKEIKELRPLTEVILMTPSEGLSLTLSIEGMKLGAFDDLLVPFDMETLLERVEEAFRQKKRKSGRRRSSTEVAEEERSNEDLSGKAKI
ncbi:response regulator [Desulforhabdus amnigena]|uniref:response regulator n=1 Tax=Desulforhabdus amnigena TaxID=40218 RepID=UPI0016B670A1|nr:response regulator [Desulforhabdus amnigena]NLJ29765.1 response regulator [Deltaproteobacteria bacterium]